MFGCLFSIPRTRWLPIVVLGIFFRRSHGLGRLRFSLAKVLCCSILFFGPRIQWGVSGKSWLLTFAQELWPGPPATPGQWPYGRRELLPVKPPRPVIEGFAACRTARVSGLVLFNDKPQGLELLGHSRMPIPRKNHVTSAGNKAASGLVEYSVVSQGWTPEEERRAGYSTSHFQAISSRVHGEVSAWLSRRSALMQEWERLSRAPSRIGLGVTLA